MQPPAPKLCQAFYLWMLIHKHMQPTAPKLCQAQKLCQAFHLWMLIHKAKAYALIHKAYAAYSPKLSQAFYMWMLIHKAKACAAYSPKALQSNLSSKLEYHIQP